MTEPADESEHTVPLYDDEIEDLGEPPKWVLGLILGAIVGLVAANNIGRTLLTKWAVEGTGSQGGRLRHPVWILGLNSQNVPLLATGFQVDWPWFLTVPMLRLLAPDPLFYLLGHFYRERAKRFIRSLYPGADQLFDLMSPEHESQRMGRLTLDGLVLIAPNNPICAIAGVLAMPVRRFVALNLLGTLGRLVLFKFLSMGFRSEVGAMIDWIARYQSYLFAASLVLLVVNVVLTTRRVSSAERTLRD